MDFLSEIISAKRRRVEAAQGQHPLEIVRARARERKSAQHRLREALRDRSRPNIIAEFKRRSPSKGEIRPAADPGFIAETYESAGAAAISVLTEEDYFGGSLDDLRRVRETTSLPVLRKDFIFDEYQIYESAAAGADALLLIVAALDESALARLRAVAEDEIGMDALVEVHTKEELDRAVACGAGLIGVNNRDLRTFEVSVSTSRALARLAPAGAILVSESGLTPADIRGLRNSGYSGFLVGENLMHSDDPARTIRELIGTREPSLPKVKICGITNLDDARAAIDAGADMLGFNFYLPSPRYIQPDAAREIITALRTLNSRITMVGIFVNESLENVIKVAEQTGLDAIQLHGDETVEYCRQLRAQAPARLIFKVIDANGATGVPEWRLSPADAFMVDAHDPNLRGGTGRTADWTFAREAAGQLPRLFLAGGLSPENVAEAINAVGPYAVDACSALEISPGKKDPARMKEFVAAVRASKLSGEAIAE